jgi:hypothetical protein
MATEFDAARGRLGRLPLLAAGALWLLSLISGLFVGLAVGLLAVVAIGLPMVVLGLSSVAGFAFFGGWLAVVAWALLAPPIGAVNSERIATRVSAAAPPDPANPADQAIAERVATIAVAAGVQPDVRIVDAPFVDAAGVGRRRVGGRGQPVVIISRGAATLPEPLFRALAASALTDAVDGRAAAVARAFAFTPPLLPVLTLRRLFRAAHGHWLRWIANAYAFMFAWGLIAAFTASGTSDNVVVRALVSPFVAVGFTLLLGFILFMVGGTMIVWLFVLAVPGEWFASRARAAADVAAIELTRDPASWTQLISGAPSRPVKPGWLDRAAVGWTLPTRPAEAQRRVSRLSRLQGMAGSLRSS